MDAHEIEVMKDAARRLQHFLAGRNIKVGHAVALEALSVSLGARNWRTVRDKLSAPVAVAAEVPLEPAAKTLDDFPEGRWIVRGRDYDGGVCGDYFAGDNPLEAKIWALYARWYDDRDKSFKVDTVIDQLTGEEVDFKVLSIGDLDDHVQMFVKVLAAAQKVLNYLSLSSASQVKGVEFQAFVSGLQAALASKELGAKLNNCAGSWHELAPVNEFFSFKTANGEVLLLDVEMGLRSMAELLEQNKDQLSENEHEAMYQFGALMGYFGDEIRQILTVYFSAE